MDKVSSVFLLAAVSLIAEYICHVYVRQDGLSGVVMADGEYPQRVAHSLINKVCF